MIIDKYSNRRKLDRGDTIWGKASRDYRYKKIDVVIMYGGNHMGIFDKIKEPVILKEDSSAKNQLRALEQILTEIEDKILDP